MDSKDVIIEELRAVIAKLEVEIVDLKVAKANKDSSTSSKPPSSDIAKPKPKKKRKLPVAISPSR